MPSWGTYIDIDKNKNEEGFDQVEIYSKSVQERNGT